MKIVSPQGKGYQPGLILNGKGSGAVSQSHQLFKPEENPVSLGRRVMAPERS